MNAMPSERLDIPTSGIDRRRNLSVPRLAATGGASAAVIFILCWAGTFIPFSSPTHAYITLFTPAQMRSVQALVEGTGWSFLFGAFAGAVLALCYNLFAGLEGR